MGYAARVGKLDWVGIGIVVGFLIFVFSIALCIVCLPERTMPSAIDVYRGTTALEVTYRSGVPVDSVVVFKNEHSKEE